MSIYHRILSFKRPACDVIQRTAVTAIGVLSVLAASITAKAATLSFASSAPTGTSAAISSWTGATFDADNVGGTGVNSNGSPNNGTANDNTTYVTNNRPAQGQTFTTGNNSGGYTLTSITVQMAGYTNNNASGWNNTFWNLTDTSSSFTVRVGEISGTTFIPLTIERAASGGPGNPGSSNSANGPGTYLTFTLANPIVLQPNTVYGFDLGSPNDYFEMLGIRDGATGGNPYTAGAAYTTGSNGVGNNVVAMQAGDRVFQVNLTAYTPPAPGVFVHPGLLHGDSDFERMRTKVAMGAQPWLEGWNAFTSSWPAADALSWTPDPLPMVYRGGSYPQNSSHLANDIAVAYASAIYWKVTGDTAYADKAVQIMNAWSSTLTGLGGDTNVDLLAGLQGYEFANVGEIMRTYPGLSGSNFAQFQSMMLNYFYPINHDFLNRHNGTCYSHYWANWDQCSLASVYAIGVLCDGTDKTAEATNYFYNGVGNGDMDRAVYYVHPGYLGQWQESGRDQGHSTLGIALVGALCEMAWHQGVDLYGFDNNRFLAGAEYVAKYNLFYTVPFVPYDNCENNWYQATVANGSQGSTRPEWELIYNHYVNRLGMAAPYTAQFAGQIRPEGYGNSDQFGWGTLTFSLDPIASGTSPSGLTAAVTGQQPVLSWWGSAYATSYNIKRSTVSGGPYTTIATGTTNTYTDTSVTSGTYYYVVTASGTFGETAASNEASAFIGTQLTARLKFDETSGSTAADATGNGWTGTLVNGGTWATGKMGNAVSLSGSAYVSLPAGAVANLSDFTISTWVYLNSVSTWTRVFDFGTGIDRYMYLTAKAGSGHVRFAITGCSSYGEEGIEGAAALPTGQWVHVAVTLSGSTGTLYVNGVPVGQNNSMSFSPFRLSTTTQNYIGHSQWSGDPYLNGLVDDFRIYQGALSESDISSLASTQQVRLKFDESSGTSAADATGNGWTGTLVNGPTWVAGQSGNAVNLNGSSQYVGTPTGVVSNVSSATFTAWVNLASVSNWMRIFDFGTGTTDYLFLTPKNGANGKVRFAITTGGANGEQKIDGAATLPTGGWHHVAVTLSGSTGLLYVDGVLSGSNTAMTLNPSSLGSTTQNWIGRSQYSGDPYLNGNVDDFRIFGSALSASEVASLYTPLSAPISFTATAGDGQVALSWGAVGNAEGYVIRRSTTSGGPYTVIAGGITGTTFTDTGLTDGVTYYYIITAANVLAESATSTQVSAMPVPPPPSAPTGLSGIGWNGEVDLSWTASTGGPTSYNIKRSTTSGGPYTTIATGTTTNYADTSAVNGTTYYYVVSASNLGGESANSSEVAVTFTQPRVYLKFDETSGSTAADSSGNGWLGTLVNGALWSSGRSNDSVDLDGTNQYVSLASGVVSSVSDFTIMEWVNLDSLSTWSRIFDFGTGTSVYMFLTPKNGANGKIRFAITTSGGSGEQKIDGTAPLAIEGWHHVAVTLSGSIGTLYVDGTQAGQNTAMTLNPSSLGTTTQNWIGHSQYSADPYLAGRVDDFRIYTRALSSAEITSLMATSPAGMVPAPATLTATGTTSQIALSWGASTGATNYDVLRATVSGGPYSAVATGLTTTSYTDTTVTSGTTYYYVIIAYSSSSESPNSPEASAQAQ